MHAPSRTGGGHLPASTSRLMWRVETPSSSASASTPIIAGGLLAETSLPVLANAVMGKLHVTRRAGGVPVLTVGISRSRAQSERGCGAKIFRACVRRRKKGVFGDREARAVRAACAKRKPPERHTRIFRPGGGRLASASAFECSGLSFAEAIACGLSGSGGGRESGSGGICSALCRSSGGAVVLVYPTVLRPFLLLLFGDCVVVLRLFFALAGITFEL